MSPNDRNERSINRTVNELIKNVENQVGEENTLFYLQSAIKNTIRGAKKNKTSSGNQESKKRKYNSDKRGDSEMNEGNIIGAVNIADDIRILNALKEVAPKYIIYSKKDKREVLKLHTVVRNILQEQDYTTIDYPSLLTTRNLLRKNKYYAALTTRRISSWHKNADRLSQKPGRKIELPFESEVWGNLMLCAFEDKEDDEVD